MNGAHDMGGVHGFGPVVQEADEPVFHAEWEARVLALSLAAGGKWNIDMSRFAREDSPPADYLARSYYEMWLYGLEKLLVEHEMVSAEELDAARSGSSFDAVATPRFEAEEVEGLMRRGGSARIDDVDVAPQFSVGQPVRVTMDSPHGHTRCPRYVRGRRGVIELDHGVFVFPDENAKGLGPAPQHVYAVRFDATELWGSASQGGSVMVDLFDDYLLPVERSGP